MGKFCAKTPKRHRVWSNCPGLLSAIVQKAGYMSKLEQSACEVKTVRKYTDKRGVKRMVGIKSVLKDSQQLGLSLRYV